MAEKCIPGRPWWRFPLTYWLLSFDKPRYIIFWLYYISDFHKTNRSMKITSNRDNQAQHPFTCTANTSEHCSFSWRETYHNSFKSSDMLSQTIDLKDRDVKLSSMRCRAECVIRNKVCVSEPMFIEFPSVAGKFLVSLADKISVSILTFTISGIYTLQIQSPDLDGWPVTARSNSLSYNLSYLWCMCNKDLVLVAAQSFPLSTISNKPKSITYPMYRNFDVQFTVCSTFNEYIYIYVSFKFEFYVSELFFHLNWDFCNFKLWNCILFGKWIN